MANPKILVPFVELNARYMNSMMTLANRLPQEVIYACAVQVFVHATTGKYSSTNCPNLSAVECINRYMQDKIIPFEKLPKGDEDVRG